MKKIFLLIFSFFTVVLTLAGCTKKEYQIIADELNDEKFNYVDIYDENNESKSVICNYVKSVWGGNTDPFDVHDTIFRYSYNCDFNKSYSAKINLPTNDHVRITGVTKYYFYDFSYEKTEKSKEQEYEIEDYVMTINIDYEEFNNSHVFQYYKINFKVDKTHYGYYYFGIRYGNELKSLKSTFTFLNDVDNNSLEYLKIISQDKIVAISNLEIQGTLISFINDLYLVEIDLSDYSIAISVTFEFKLTNDDTIYSIEIDSNFVCQYEGNYYHIISRDKNFLSYINTKM